MDVFRLSPGRVPERALVTGVPGPARDDFLRRLALAMDVPLVSAADLGGPTDLARLAAFDGWVTTADHATARAVLLERADVVVQVQPEVGALRSLMRRTVRRIRAEAPDASATWVDELAWTHPDLTVVRLTGEDEAAAWLRGLGA